MTFRQAATLARMAGARELWLTHFSPSMDAPHAFAREARAVFANTIVARDGQATSLHFRDDPAAASG
jgi:ribonuclease Z